MLARRSPGPFLRGAGALLGIVLALAVFFAPALLGAGQFLFRDTGRMHHPVKAFLAEELRHGRLPQWNPYMGLGVPLVPTGVDAVQHPFNLLLAVLPFEAGFKAWVLLSYLAAAVGAYGWARRSGRSRAPALATGLAYALSGFLVSSSDNVQYLTAAAFVPWMLWAAEAYLRDGGPGRLGAVGAASWCCVSAGDPLAWGIALAVATVRGLVGAAPAPRGTSVRRAGLAAVASAVGAAPVMLPMLRWIPHTRRFTEGVDAATRGQWDLHPARVLELVLPGLFESGAGRMSGGAFQAYAGDDRTTLPWLASIYVGVACVALAVLALRRSRAARVLLGAALVSLWAATGHHLGFSWIAEHLPVLASFRYWEKLVVWPTLFVALAAGVGLEELLGDPRSARRFAIGAGSAALVALAGWGGLQLFAAAGRAALGRPGVAPADTARLLENLQRGTASTAVVLAALAVAALARGRGVLARSGPVVLVAIVALDLASASARAYVLAPPELLRPSPRLVAALQGGGPAPPRIVTPFDLPARRWPELGEFQSMWRWGGATLSEPWNVAAHVANVGLYTGLTPARLDDLQLDRALIPQLVPAEGLWGVEYVVVPGRPEVAVRAGLRPPFEVAAADRELPVYLLRLPHRPRAYLADEVASVDAAGARAFALDPGSVASRRTVIEDAAPAAAAEGPPGTAAIVDYAAERVEVDVRAARRALLVLNDQDCPGWAAEIDGVPRPIHTANYLARGVWVEPGSHRVVFRYRTPGLAAGWAAVAAGLLALAGWALRRARGGRRAAS